MGFNVQTFLLLYFFSYSSNRDFLIFLMERKAEKRNYAHSMKLANQRSDFPFLPSRLVFYASKKLTCHERLHRKCALPCKQGNRDASFP